MKTTFTLKILMPVLLNLILQGISSAGIIPVSSDHSTKNLFVSAESKLNSETDGTIVSWLEESFRGSLYIQKLGSKGEKLWIQSGVAVDKDLGRQSDPDSDYPLIFSDKNGGAVVIYRKVFYSKEEIYCAKISSAGEVIRKTCLSSGSGGYNFSPSAALTNDNSIVIVWENFSSGDFNIQGQKIDNGCNKLWNGGNEVVICGEPGDQRKPSVMCDRKNQLLISWLDTRTDISSSEFTYDLYANKIDENGSFSGFGNSGKLLLSFPSHRNSERNENAEENLDHGNGPVTVKKAELYNHNMILSDNNSAIIAVDIRELESDSYIKVFKVNEELNIEWDRDIDEESFQQDPLIVSDGSEGAVIVWNDCRDRENSIYGMRINGSGTILSDGDNGIKISYDNGKKNSHRSLPDKRNTSGLVFKNDKVFIPWTVSDSRNLFIVSLDLTNGPQYKITPELVCENVSDDKCNSIICNNGMKTIVFSKNNTIFVSVENNEDKISMNQSKNNLKMSVYPNPFNPVTKISYELTVPGNANVKIYDVTGRIVKELINEFQNAGRHELNFDGNSLSGGLYFCRIVAGDYIETMKMTLLK